MNRVSRIAVWPIELVTWVSALVFLYFSNPDTHHHTLCPLANAGFEWCPGCGIGRSITLLMHGRLLDSIEMHILGVPVFLILLHSIFILSKNYFFPPYAKSYGPS